MGLPLEGIKVVELAQSLGSPWCTSMMADFGAEVINVEPRHGARTRKMGTTFLKGECPWYFALHRGKKGITVDIRKPHGQEIVKKLVKNADLVTENFRPGVLDRLGLGYDALSKINPKLLYLSITGFGAEGPWKDRPGIELIFQAYSGLMSIQGEDEHGMPRHIGAAVSDMAAGVMAFIGVMLALYERKESRLGQRIDVSNLTATLSMFNPHAQIQFFGGPPRGMASSAVCPFRSFATKDGYMAIGLPSDQYWPNFCKALGIEDLRDNPLFATNVDRVKNREATEAIIQSTLEQKATGEWLEIFKEADAIGGPVNTFADIANDPQILANDMVVTVDHPVCGETKMIGIPIKLSRTPGRIGTPPPTMGQHTDKVLQEIGYSQQEIEELRKLKVV
ncbi:CaiB/BaiF CoA transferase family protein [Chloroflexota bacterium]